MKRPHSSCVYMTYRILLCSTIIFFLSISSILYAAPNVPNNFDGWTTDALNKLEVSGVTGSFHRHTLPLSREDIALIVRKAVIRMQSGSVTISDIDRKILEKLKREFHNELALLNHQDTHDTVLQRTNVNIQPEIRAANEEIAPALQSGLHFTIGNRHHQLLAYSELEVANFEQGQGFVENYFLPVPPMLLKSADQRYEGWHWDYVFDFKRSYLQYNLSFSNEARISLLFGRDCVYWGTSPFKSVGISDNSPPFELMRLTGTIPCKYGTLKATAFTAQLNSTWFDDGTARYLAKRYLSAHRVDYRFSNWLEIGVSEWVLYGGDSQTLKWHYLNPIIPYYAVQYNAKNDDNLMLSFDGAVRPIDGVRLYAEWLADDFQYQSDSNDPHAVAWLTGVEWYPEFVARQLGFQTEYVRVNRWAYTHLEPDNQFTHFGTLIGHPIGTDADLLTFRVSYHATPSAVIYVSFSHQRDGEADITDRFYGENFVNIPFPSGIVERLTEFRLSWKYRPIKGLKSSLNYAWRHIQNSEHVADETEQLHRFVILMAYVWGK